jgi:lipopolysaccharide biosynthesis glycosyltransferase
MNCLDYATIAISSLLKTNPKGEILLFAKDCNPVFPNVKTIPIKDIEHLNYNIQNIAVNALDLLGHRLKILDELKEKYDKIIMLDTDIIVLESLEDLFSLSENYIYGRDELDLHTAFRKSINSELWYKPRYYLNSGVLVLPSKVLRTVNLFEKFKKELALRSEKYVCPEQDLLNYVFRDKTFNLGDRINQFVTNREFKNPKVIHYAGVAKPLRVNPILMFMSKYFYNVFDEHLERNKQFISKEFYLNNKNALRAKDNLI